jgi:hypothetical protein
LTVLEVLLHLSGQLLWKLRLLRQLDLLRQSLQLGLLRL